MEVHGELKGGLLERVSALPNPPLPKGHKVYLLSDNKEYKSKGDRYVALKDEETDDPATNYDIEEAFSVGNILSEIDSTQVNIPHGRYRLRVQTSGGAGGASTEKTFSVSPYVFANVGGGGGGSGAVGSIVINVPTGKTYSIVASAIGPEIAGQRLATYDIYNDIYPLGTSIYSFAATTGQNGYGATEPVSAWDFGAIGNGGSGGIVTAIEVDGIKKFPSGIQLDDVYHGVDGGDGGYYSYSETANDNTVIRAIVPYKASDYVYGGAGAEAFKFQTSGVVAGENGSLYGEPNKFDVFKIRGVLDV